MLFPMYTVPSEALLQMTAVEPHEVLKAKGVLVKFEDSKGKAAFISHQWVGGDHPDPEFRQFSILQAALRKLLTTMRSVPLDYVSEGVVAFAKSLKTDVFKSRPLFFWYDYFCCPQMEHRISTCHATLRKESDLLRAIQSIPAYVKKSEFFFALCPVVESPSEGKVFTHRTWAERGWCRVERVMREMSTQSSWILIQSETRIQLLGTPISFPGGPVGEGKFTVPEDRNKLGPVLMQALVRKIRYLLRMQDFASYRLTLSMQQLWMRGIPGHTMPEIVPGFAGSNYSALGRFFHDYGFVSARQVDRGGWAPLHYAALSGDVEVLRGLLDQKAALNCRARRPRPQLLGGVLFMSALDVAIFSGQTEAVRLLVQRGAKLSGLIDAVIYSAISGKAECIRILQELRPDYNVNPRMFYGADTLQAACAYATMDVVDELLKQEHVANDKAVLSKGLCLAATNWGCSPQLVLKLVEYGADVNFQLRASHFALSYQVVSKYFALRYRLGVRSPISVMMYHLDGLTPLMACLFTGQYDGAAALLASGARPELRNSRGWNAEDVIKGQTIPGWLKNGMAGQLSDCEDVASLALGNEGFVETTF